MANLQKTVLIVQASKRQAEIWQAALISQTVPVLLQSSNADLCDEDLHQIINVAKKLEKLDLLLLDVGIPNLNPYTFCHSYHEQQLNLKIILTNGGQNEVTSAECRWAIYQGAQDLLPGFQQETPLEEGVARVNRVLEVLEWLPLQHKPLIPILLPLTSSTASLEQETTSHQLSHQLNDSGAETDENLLSSKPEPTSNTFKPAPTSDTSTLPKRKGHSYRG